MSPKSRRPTRKASAKSSPKTKKIRLGKPTSAKMQMLMGKALTDDNFRALLGKDPQAAAAEVGIRFGPAQAQQIKEIQSKIENLAGELKDQGTVAVAVLIPIADVAIVAAFA